MKLFFLCFYITMAFAQTRRVEFGLWLIRNSLFHSLILSLTLFSGSPTSTVLILNQTCLMRSEELWSVLLVSTHIYFFFLRFYFFVRENGSFLLDPAPRFTNIGRFHSVVPEPSLNRFRVWSTFSFKVSFCFFFFFLSLFFFHLFVSSLILQIILLIPMILKSL